MRRRPEVLLYWLLLPILTLVNLGLGLGLLSWLHPHGWRGWLEIGAGAFCCFVAGLLFTAVWSRSYWGAAMEAQITRWKRMADVIFCWLEDAPVSADAIQRLQGSLDDVMNERAEPHPQAQPAE